MPAMVHDVLRTIGQLPEPWLPGEAVRQAWVAQSDWVYALSFDAPELPVGARAHLHFGGVDTVADIYLNGALVAHHSNAFTPFRPEVTQHLRAAGNSLVLHLRSFMDPQNPTAPPLPLVDGDPARPIRRTRYRHDTYLGPQPFFHACGPWSDIALEIAQVAEMARPSVGIDVSADLSRATLDVQAHGWNSGQAGLRLRAVLTGPDGAVVEHLVEAIPEPAPDGSGHWSVSLRIDVVHPQLWWPKGFGKQDLHTLDVSLLADGAVVQHDRRTIGVRRAEMRGELQFFINNRRVRLWGGNWVSPDWTTEVWDANRAEALLDIADNANFNCLRVWAQVAPPADSFYDSCERRGILVWQDFTYLPLAPDAASRETCRVEAAAMVRRLRHRACILLWCGGNEGAMFHDPAFGGPGGEWPGRGAAERDVAEVVRALDPGRFYLPNSPYFGQDPNDPRQWNTHGYTNHWFVPGFDYLRFATEDTRVSAPEVRSLRKFMPPEELWPEGYSTLLHHGDEFPWPPTWQSHTTRLGWKKTGPVEQFHDATTPEEMVHRLGLAASQYHRETIERQRRGRAADAPSDERRCGGYLIWKFNDSWPQVYTGKVDYFLEPYPALHAIKRAYAPVLLSFEIGTFIWLWLVNDTAADLDGEVVFELYDMFSDTVRAEVRRQIHVKADESLPVFRLDEVGVGTFSRDHVLFAELRSNDGQVLARANAFAEIDRRLEFPDAGLTLRTTADGVEVTSDRFARCIVLNGATADGDAFGWQFEDNWFDLMPSERRLIRVRGSHSGGVISAKAFHCNRSTSIAWNRGDAQVREALPPPAKQEREVARDTGRPPAF